MPVTQQTEHCTSSQLPLLQAFSAICSACETIGNSLTPNLPVGWQTETINGTTSAYCGDCAIDLPKADTQ
jgi:hypothetical protein